MSTTIQHCSVCGGSSFTSQNLLWPELIQQWQLSSQEAAYIDRQQGTSCQNCGCNLRSIALAKAILSAMGSGCTFRGFLATPRSWFTRVLEINEAGPLSRWLRGMPRRRLVSFPEADMQRLPYPDRSYDLVLHSDTLEHVADPLQGLRECLRVLRPGGWCCFTIPIITGRMSRSRKGLPPSYHGRSDLVDEGFLVHTEYGSDAWEQVMQAGFEECRLLTAEFPSAQAIAARRPLRS